MNIPTSRRVAAITGAAGGIGRGIAANLFGRGFDIVACDRAFDADARDALGQLASQAQARLAFVSADLAALTDFAPLVEQIHGAFDRIDCLVNNAGVSVKSRGDLLDVAMDSYDQNFAVNTRAAFFLTQAVTRRMLAEQKQSAEGARSVVFISSSNAVIAAIDRGEYSMSKASVSMMSKLFALRLAPHGIAVYEVRPGLIETPMTAVAQTRFDQMLADGFTPINRWGQPQDVGRAVAALAAGELPFSTGVAVQIDGGMHIHQY
ncbi:3-ketoacyl-ACP reductase [Variovorax sp. HJSM1_2]|uniref:3-ketoacyl-ACP reductase n=1 Tax=Variovorax sp. HJSM1_2 TaxID=3366263 RepID=UPI003BDA293A